MSGCAFVWRKTLGMAAEKDAMRCEWFGRIQNGSTLGTLELLPGRLNCTFPIVQRNGRPTAVPQMRQCSYEHINWLK